MHASSLPSSDNGSGWVFWFLFALAAIAFAPCVLLPEWRDYQAAQMAAEAAARQNARVRNDLDRQRHLLDALKNDPVVIERLARRELAYDKLGETIIPVALTDDEEPAVAAEVIDAPAPPAPIERVLAWLPFAADDNLFCDPSTRRLIMALCGALIVSAFILFPPKRALGQ